MFVVGLKAPCMPVLTNRHSPDEHEAPLAQAFPHVPQSVTVCSVEQYGPPAFEHVV